MVIVRQRNIDEPLKTLTPYINVTPTIGVWNINATAVLLSQWFKVSVPDPESPGRTKVLDFSGDPMAVIQMFNTFSLKKNWQLELGGEYHTPGTSENYKLTNHYFDLSAAVQKAFLKDGSLIVRLAGSDLAGLALQDVFCDCGGHVINQTNKFDTQRITLSVKYKFNSAASKYKGTGAGKETAGRIK